MPRPATDLARALGRLPIFQALSIQDLELLAQGSRFVRLARNDVVFRTGEPCDAFHVLLEGQVKLFVLSPQGQEKVIQIVGPNQSFGEAIVFLERPYILSAQALTDGLMINVGKRAIFDGIERDPRFALRMLAGMSQRLHGLVRDVESQALHSGLQRVIGYLMSDADADIDVNHASPVTITLPVSKATIASRLSLTPEYFSRVLHELESAGLIRVDRRDIHIPDPAALSAYRG